ncbi:molybdopterin-dependent oxidoreductase [Bosea sp. R86505]|uniref:molybdopterin-dependent oxidoreductase n=1 Tax=Bosea sp. R86505 TaxID=3101710 RepID=UPI00366BEA36|nr:formate dehydrogenase subunit alpha [Sphingopyxis sp.]
MSVFEIEVDGRTITAKFGQSVLEAALAAGVDMPHLCACTREGYQPIGTCRTCLVELDGDDELVPACRQSAAPGLKVNSDSVRARRTRRAVVELLASEMSKEATQRHPDGLFHRLVQRVEADASRFGHRPASADVDRKHPAITVDSDACIRCGKCRAACQDVQVNGVIALAGRGDGIHVAFDTGLPMGDSSCVSCGECAQVCPTGALSYSVLSTINAPPPIEHVGETVCPFCSVGCRVDLHVAEDRIVYAEGADGPANHGRLCVKGRFGFSYLRHPDRLTTPLIRRDDAPKVASHNLRGREVLDLFRPASWDEALDHAARGFRSLRESRGGDVLAVLGSAKGTNEAAYVLQKLARTGFGTNHVDHCTRLCASVPPLAEATGFSAVTIPIEQIAQANVALIVGSNPETNHPVAASYMKNAIRRGTKLILIDPYCQSMVRLATLHLQLRPGTDVALLSAMTRLVITEGLYDRQFVNERLEGFDELVQRVVPYTPDVAERICGVPAAMIAEAARMFANAPAAMTFWGMGASQHVHGADNIRATIAFAMVCGQVGRPGAGLHPLRGQNNVQGSCDAGLMPNYFPGYRSLKDTTQRNDFSNRWSAELPEEKGLTVVEIVDAIRCDRIKGLYVVGGNPAMANPDLAATREALARLDHLVVQDIFTTETTAFADVILPAAALAESAGTVTNTDRIIQVIEPALPPPGDAREDWAIVCGMASQLGLPWARMSLEATFNEMAAMVPMLNGFNWRWLKNERCARYPIKAKDPGQGIQPASALTTSHDSLFATDFPRGNRAQLAALDGNRTSELPDGRFPLTLVTGRLREHWHTGSMTRRAAILDALSPEALVHINPKDFERFDLASDRFIRVETRRGSVSVRPLSDRRIQEGVIWLPMSFFEAAANELTISKLDDYTRVPAYKFCAARVVDSR